MLTLKVQLWLCRVVIAVKQQTKRKNIRQNLTTTNTEGKNKIKDNKPCILAGLRHIFAIISSQISTMMGTSDAILKHETTNRR